MLQKEPTEKLHEKPPSRNQQASVSDVQLAPVSGPDSEPGSAPDQSWHGQRELQLGVAREGSLQKGYMRPIEGMSIGYMPGTHCITHLLYWPKATDLRVL